MKFEQFGELRGESVLRAVQNMKVCMFRYFPQEHIIWNTAETCRVFPCREIYRDAPASFIWDFVCEEDAGAVQDLYGSIDRGQLVASAEFRGKSSGWCRVTISVTDWDGENRPAEAVGMIEPISDSAHGSFKANWNEQLYTTLQAFHIAAEATGNTMFIFDAKRQSILVGSTVADEFGVMEEQHGVPYETVKTGIIPEDSKAEYIRLHEAMMHGAREAHGIVNLVAANGETGVYELRFRAMLDKDGNPSGRAVGVYQDITRDYLMAQEQQSSLQDLRQELIQQESRARTEHRRLMEAIYALSAEYNAIYQINLEENTCMPLRGADSLHTAGESYEAFFRDFCRQAVLPEDQALVLACGDRQYLREQLRERSSYSQEYRSSTHDWCRGRFVAESRDEQGQAKNVLFVTQIIDQEKKRELDYQEALRTACEAANRASAAKTTFLSNMSHDIRTPMNAIIGFASIAAAHAEDAEKVRDCLKKILSSSEHLQSLISEILDMSRIESGKTVLEERKTSLSEIVRSVMPLIQPQIQSKQIDFYVDTVNIRDEYVWADTLKLRQILINILGNAVKFTHMGGTISLRIMQQDSGRAGYGSYRFVVKDTGLGMNEDFVPHIFEPFERASNSTASGVTGTGLGMPIAKSLAEMMGGEILVESRLGQGSTFTVNISLKLQTDVPVNRRVQELHGLRVLVVDDDFQSCDTITKMLSEVGMRSDWTTSARDALLRARKAYSDGDRFYAYIIDWIMPEMNGLELVRRIRRSIGAEIPIIILTAYDWSEIEAEAKDAGVTAFCAKPLFLSDLTEALLCTSDACGSETEEAPAGFSGERVLVVEDNELNREMAAELLQEIGLSVDTAYDGLNAVEKLARSKPGEYRLVLMDVQMPAMNGYDATRQIRQMGRTDLKNLPIVAMTANAFAEDVEAASVAGMNDHLAKPFHMERVIATLRKYLK